MLFNLLMFPAVVVGVLIGKWLLPRTSQKQFDTAILGLAALGALRLIFS